MASKYGRAAQGDAVVVQGFAQLQAALRRIEDGTERELQAKLREIGTRVALVAAGNAPRLTGELQHSIRTSVGTRSASVYSNAVYGGVQNVGAWEKVGRGPHVKRSAASHYMERAVAETALWVEREMDSVIDWLMTTFEEDR